MKNYKYIVSVVLVVLLFSCKDKEVLKKEILRPVRFEVVGTSGDQKTRTFSGIAKASDEIELSFRSSGIISVLNIRLGLKVKKGDLLAKLDNVQAELAYEQAISGLNSAKSSMNTAKSNLDRIKTLYAKGSNSLSDYEAAKNNYQSSLDEYRSANKNRDIKRSQINYGYIYAAKDGTIASKEADLNENASAGQLIGVLNAGNKTNIMIGLPENIINKVKLGMQPKLNFSSISGRTFIGKVIEISPIAEVNSASYPVKIDITDTNEAVKPGMSADVTFEFRNLKNVIEDNTPMIPVKSVGENGAGNFVFLVESSDGITGVVKKQPIVIGELTVNGFKVVSGLSKGQKIATAGLQTLLDGQKVKLH
jgi:RND family efflux transporter MFP subunit